MGAAVGDDVYGEDETVNTLQSRAAELFGMQAALYCPTGTMTNQIGIRVHAQPGDEVICHELAHIYVSEGGGIASNSGASVRLMRGNNGRFTADDVRESVNRRDDSHLPWTRLVAIENTVNKGGGCCWELAEISRIRQVCDEHGLALHLDGARLFNAIAARGESPRQFGRLFDTISVCLSKGLGAPAGSLLLMPEGRSEEARSLRRRLGGSMRQVGILAAGAYYALENNLDRLSQDRENARRIATALRTAGASVREPETNIVLVDAEDAPAVAKECFGRGVRISAFGPKLLRIVTHLDVSAQDCDTAADVVSSVLMQSPERG